MLPHQFQFPYPELWLLNWNLQLKNVLLNDYHRHLSTMNYTKFSGVKGCSSNITWHRIVGVAISAGKFNDIINLLMKMSKIEQTLAIMTDNMI